MCIIYKQIQNYEYCLKMISIFMDELQNQQNISEILLAMLLLGYLAFVIYEYLIIKLLFQTMTSTKTTTKTETAIKLASKIQVDNILQLSLVQTTLQSNFKAILEALSQHDTDIDQLKQKNNANSDYTTLLNNGQDAMKKQIQEIRDIVDKMRMENTQIKSAQAIKNQKSNAPNPESSPSIMESLVDKKQLQSLTKQLRQLQQKTNKNQSNASKNADDFKSEIDHIKKQIQKLFNSNNGLQGKVKQLEKISKQLQNSDKQHSAKIKQLQNQIQKLKSKDNSEMMNIQKIMKQLGEMNKQIGQFSEAKYKADKQKIDAKLSQLQKISSQVKNSVEEEKRLRSKLGQQLWKMHDSVSKISQSNLSDQIINDSVRILKKEVSDLQKKMNQLTNADSSNKAGSKNFFNDSTRQSPSKYKMTEQSPEKGQDSGKYQDLREEMLDKMKQLRSDFLKTLKKLGVKSEEEAGSQKKKFDSIEEAILRIQHILGEKANADTVKKLVSNLENKMSYIYNIFFGQANNQQDACIARKNWVCLSCDKKLDKYQGKIGHHLVNTQLKAKGLDQDNLGGGMLLRPTKSKVDLPTVFSKSAKKQ